MATSLHAWQSKPISLSPLAFLLAWRVPTGSQRVPKGLQEGTPKWPKIDQKSIRAALGIPKGVRGYPPGTELIKIRIYSNICIFMHIFAIFVQCHIYACFHWFSAFLCILLYTSPIFMHIQTYLWLFMYMWCIFVYICALRRYLYIFTHIHEKTLICWQWKIMQPGYTPQGAEISVSTLNIDLSASFTGSIDIHSNAEPEWPHGTVAGSALCAYRYTFV